MPNPTPHLPPALFVSEELTLWGIGHREPHAGIVTRAERQGYLLLFFGSDILLWSRGEERRGTAHTFLLLSPHEALRCGLPQGFWEYSWIECRGTLLEELVDAGTIPLDTLVPFAETQGLDDLLRLLATEVRSGTPDGVTVRQLFHNCLVKIRRRTLVRGEAPQIPPVLLEIQHYLSTHYPEALALSVLARQFHLSPGYCCREFKRHFGVPPSQYLRQLRMAEAVRLLRDTELPITVIASQVGYEDITYFSRTFHQYADCSPRQARKNAHAATGSPAGNTQPRSSGWRSLVEVDFRTGGSLDSRWGCYLLPETHSGKGQQPAPERMMIREGALHLLPAPHWTNLRWEEESDEEVKVEVTVVNTPPDGPNLAIALSGDITTGYRLRVDGYNHLELETIRHGYWEVLYHLAATLDPAALSYTLTLQRVENEFVATLNGRRIMTYYDPYAPYGPAQRTFALGRFWEGGSAAITELRVFTRQKTLAGDVLAPGRVMLTKGYQADARQWFHETLQETSELAVREEARYLLALTLPDDDPEKETVLQQIATEPVNRFRLSAARARILLLLKRARFAEAVEETLQLTALTTEDGTPREVADKIVEAMRHAPLPQRPSLLELIARLPVAQLYLHSIHLESLAPLHGTPLRELRCYYTGVADLTPLTGMPLATLLCVGNQVEDLSPLCEMAIHQLSCAQNRIRELTPLCGMPLHTLSCQENTIADLAPLQGMALTKLLCGNNQLTSLAPLTGMPLTTINCDNNVITDLTPLAHSPLTYLQCQHNRITELSPLRHTPLETLLCRDNPLTDLTPLAGLPLTRLEIGDIPLDGDNGETVASLPLQHLCCTPTPRALEVAARIPSLQTLNGHPVTTMETHWPALQPVMAVWRRDEVALESVDRKERHRQHYHRGEPLQRAVEFLQSYLTQHPGAAATEVFLVAQSNAIHVITLRRAKKYLSITSRRLPGQGKNGPWGWYLPEN